jgi:hypothetical protein
LNTDLNCPNCDFAYAETLAKCPKCGALNPLDSYRKSSQPKPQSKILIISVVAAVSVVGGVIAVFYTSGMLGPHNTSNINSDNTEVKNNETNSIPIVKVTENTSNQNNTTSHESYSKNHTQQVHYVTVKTSKRILSTTLSLFPKDSTVLSLKAPNDNVTALEGMIDLNSHKSVMISFYDNPKNPNLCTQPTQCTFIVKGSTDPYYSHVTKTFSINLTKSAPIFLKVENTDPYSTETMNINITAIYNELQAQTPTLDNETASPVKATVNSSSSIIIQEAPAASTSNNLSSSSTQSDLQAYREYALKLINGDRMRTGDTCPPDGSICYIRPIYPPSDPVALSNNSAAQVHADDILKTRQISHWMTNGEKPYMTFTRYGGLGFVAQNVYVSGYSEQDRENCISGLAICPKINPLNEIKNGELQMMFNDQASNNGHQANILEKHHTHVSIGIAYDDYFFVMVQNFENNYIHLNMPVTTDKKIITLSGPMLNTNGTFGVYSVAIFYDETPTTATYQEHRNQTYYDQGTMVGQVVAPPPPGSYYTSQPSDYQLIQATRWDTSVNAIDITFDASSVVQSHGNGVYTFDIYLANNGDTSGTSQFPVTSYSMFVP